MVQYEVVRETPQEHYAYDPHLSPQLIWAAKPGLRQIEVEDQAGVDVDTDYDGRTFAICQAFFPNRRAWRKLERALRGTLDKERFEQLTGRVSLPFKVGKYGRVAVKVIDQRGNEVMRVLGLGNQSQRG
jgi:hypothetical protein